MNWRIDWQLAVATLLVAGCAAYALWPLLPLGLRQRWRKAVGLAPAAPRGCGGCDAGCAPAKAPADGKPSGQVIQIVRRPRG